MSQDEELRSGGDIDKVVKSFKSGIGSIMGIFGKEDTSKAKKEKDKKPLKLD